MILLMITYLQWLALHVVVICGDQLAKLESDHEDGDAIFSDPTLSGGIKCQ